MRYLSLLFTCLLLLFAHKKIEATVTGTTYYVSPAGDDSSNPGTLALPWKTIQHAADTMQAGDTVLVRAGVYGERVNITLSGNAADGFITFKNYPDETPILDGTSLTVPNSENGLLYLLDVSYIRVEGLELRNYRATQAGRTAVGIHVRGSGEHIQLVRNHIHRISSLSSNTSDAHAIAVYGTDAPQSISQLLIDSNELHDLELYWSEALVLNGNVERFSITNNLVYDADNIGIDLIGFEGTSSDPYDQARDGIVADNTVYNIDTLSNSAYAGERSAAGIYVDGGTRIIIERNKVYASNMGIELASEHAGRSTSAITVRNNVLYENHIAGLAMGGYDEFRGSTRDCHIVNNTFYHNDTAQEGNGEIWLQYDIHDNVIGNNIIWAGAGSTIITNWYTQNSGNEIDYNLYYAPDVAADTNWAWKDVYIAGFAAWITATGETHSQFVDPKFISTRILDWHIQPTSLAVNNGNTAYEIGTLDIDGTARIVGTSVDIGADEIGGVTTAVGLDRVESLSAETSPILALLLFTLLLSTIKLYPKK